jgi:exodeoxyribonuclease V gamma subunit
VPTLKLYNSNRLEVLAEALSEVLRTPLASPLDQEIIVVQSKGMERWLSMALASHHGICANTRFPFPNTFVYEIFQKVLQDLPDDQFFAPNFLTWKIMGFLPSLIMQPGFESLRNYLGDRRGQVKEFQLSERIAYTFDQYLTYRPEMIIRWESGDDDQWQAMLWRKLVKETDKCHWAARTNQLLKTIKKFTGKAKALPERVSVFGISALPPLHVHIFAGLSQLTQVNLFLMNPCKEYWGDIVSDWEIKRTVDRETSQDLGSEELHLEKGNSLLASMGTLGRDFFDLVNGFNCEEVPLFEEPGENCLLLCLQSDILNLRDSGANSDAKRRGLKDDTSIQIHACHSPMREMEVLHDQLLYMFEQDPTLLPKDVLVMTPDIEKYAPYIEAVFDVPADEAERFPFNLADRSARKESQVVDAFLSILELFGSRFQASQVMAVLELRAVYERFDLSEADLELIRTWVAETRIRWGINSQSREKLGLPGFSENTWKVGLERLLLGYAMPGGGEHMFEGVLPYDHVEGGEALILGRFLEFQRSLFAHVTSLDEPRTLLAWSQTLTELIEAFILSDEDTEHEIQILRRIVNSLRSMEEIAPFDEEVDVSVIKAYLGRCLEKEGVGFGFMAGGITFCAMLPMRSIPFKVICLVGMNGDAYPRESRQLGFDLMAQHPRSGDRSRRHDDRYLFLEAILSARNKLYISHIGQSTQDNTPIPPSVLVSELMDYVEQHFEIPDRSILDRIVTKHRLQAFSPKYFKKDEELFSYSEVNKVAAQAIAGKRDKRVPFISRTLPHPEDEWKKVTLGDLCRFFRNPTKFLINKRLGMYLEAGASALDDSEYFNIHGLEKYALEQALVERRFSGESLARFHRLARAAGQLPHGTVGACLYENMASEVKRFVEQTEPYIEKVKPAPLEVDLQVSDFRITGRLDGVCPERLVQYRFARVKCKDRLSLWINHLVLNCLKADHGVSTSLLVGLHNRAGKPQWAAWEYLPVEDSEKHLKQLIRIYWDGLSRPVHFFPESSWTYAQLLVGKKKTEEEAMRGAHKSWLGDDYHRGERDDSYYHFCFEGTQPLDSEFRTLAMEILWPLMASQQEVRK